MSIRAHRCRFDAKLRAIAARAAAPRFSLGSMSAEQVAAHWRPGSSSNASTSEHRTATGWGSVAGGQSALSRPGGLAARQRARSGLIHLYWPMADDVADGRWWRPGAVSGHTRPC
eukprot:5266530-Prymnesium_polylepis.2